MSAAFYQRLNRWSRRSPRRCRWIAGLDRFLPLTMATIYLAVLIALAVQQDGRLWRCLLVPAVTLGLTTLLRRLLRCPRPYEVYPLTPLRTPHHVGLSCPSRHTASAVILALTGWYLHPALGGPLSAAAIVVAALRVLSGLHFVRDILAGTLTALLCGAIGFWLL